MEWLEDPKACPYSFVLWHALSVTTESRHHPNDVGRLVYNDLHRADHVYPTMRTAGIVSSKSSYVMLDQGSVVGVRCWRQCAEVQIAEMVYPMHAPFAHLMQGSLL